MGVRRFLRLLFDKEWQPPVQSVDDSLARTARDATHVRGGGPGGSGGAAYSGTSAVYKRIEEGYENYAKSFKKEKG